MTKFIHADTTVYHPCDMEHQTALQWLGLELKKIYRIGCIVSTLIITQTAGL